MAVALTSKNPDTNYCQFSFDKWENDKDKLPTLYSPGKDVLSTIKSCCQGSIAIGTIEHNIYTLTGNNEWVLY